MRHGKNDVLAHFQQRGILFYRFFQPFPRSCSFIQVPQNDQVGTGELFLVQRVERGRERRGYFHSLFRTEPSGNAFLLAGDSFGASFFRQSGKLQTVGAVLSIKRKGGLTAHCKERDMPKTTLYCKGVLFFHTQILLPLFTDNG